MVQSRRLVTLAVTVTMLSLSSLFLFFRFVTRLWIVRKVYLDDWFILVAWILTVGFSASICAGTAVGLGLHEADIGGAERANLSKVEYAFSVLYNPALMMTKTSILVFFLSFFKEQILFRRLSYLTLAVVIVAGVALTLLNVFQCQPPGAAIAYPVAADATCTDIVILYLSSSPVNIVTDLAMLLLPMPILTRMRLPRKQKVILVATFSAGVFVAAVDVVRMAYLQDAVLARLSAQAGGKDDPTRDRRGHDFSWNASSTFMWSAIEVNLGVMCACVPSLKPLFLRFLPSFIKDATQGSTVDSAHDSKQTPVNTNMTAGNELTNPAAFSVRSPAEKGGVYGGEGGFLDFLCASDEVPAANGPTSRSATASPGGSKFDFYSVDNTENLLKLSNRQSIRPVSVVTVLFFLWGFAYGLLDVLNHQFQRVVGTTPGEGLGLHAAYFGGYFIGPLTLGRFVLKRYGFKAAMITGLAVYGCGTLTFWPSSVLGSYVAFVVSNFIVGFGLSCLEVSANPYIAFCGPLEYAEVRLNLSQGVQAIGTILSPLLASKVLFKSVENTPSLIEVQWAYLGIALFGWALAFSFYYVKLPEASDEEFDELADRNLVANQTKVGRFRVIWVTLVLGVSSQFFYLGAQEAAGTNLGRLFTLAQSKRSFSDFVTVGQTLFAVGRFLSAFLNYILKPRWILLGLYLACIASSALAMTLSGNASIAAGELLYLFESGIFSVIFCVALRGLGSHTKTGSAFVTAAISGGAIFNVIQAAVEKSVGLRYSFCVALVAFAGGTVFAIYLNVVPAAKKQVDPVHEDRNARRRRRHVQRQQHESEAAEKNNQFGLVGIIARRQSTKMESMPTSVHVDNCWPVSEAAPSNSSTDRADGSDVDKIETIRSVSPARLREPAGFVGELKPWPPWPSDAEQSTRPTA